MEQEKLMDNALQIGNWLTEQLKQLPVLKNVRGRGLMIGFDVPAALPDLKKNLLSRQHIFTGEAKPNVIRLLPSLALTLADANQFIVSLQQEIQSSSS
jgi:acetylornithine aminotransferase